MADAETQAVTEWDEQGKPVKPQAAGVTEWDEKGNPIGATKQIPARAPAEQGPKPAGQRFKESFRGAMGFNPEGGLKSDISDIGAGFKQMATHPWLDQLGTQCVPPPTSCITVVICKNHGQTHHSWFNLFKQSSHPSLQLAC